MFSEAVAKDVSVNSIPSVMDRLGKQTAVLEDKIETLITHLGPVLRPVEPLPESKPILNAVSSDAPLVESLLRHMGQLVVLEERIQHLRGRLAID